MTFWITTALVMNLFLGAAVIRHQGRRREVEVFPPQPEYQEIDKLQEASQAAGELIAPAPLIVRVLPGMMGAFLHHLAPVSNNLQVLEEQADNADYRRQFREDGEEAIRHLRWLADKVAFLAEEGDVALQRLSIQGVVRDAVEILRYEMMQSYIDVSVEFDIARDVVMGDSRRLCSVMLDIFLDAKKGLPAGDSIKLRARNQKQDDQAWIEISVSADKVSEGAPPVSELALNTVRQHGGQIAFNQGHRTWAVKVILPLENEGDAIRI